MWTFSTRALFIVTAVLCAIFSFVGAWRFRSEVQHGVVEKLSSGGWKINYKASPPIVAYVLKNASSDYWCAPVRAVVSKDAVVRPRDIELVASLSSLEEVYILPWRTHNPGVSFAELNRLPHLRLLAIRANEISDHDIEQLSQCSGLQDLRVFDSRLSLASVRRIARFPALQRVSFGDIGIPKPAIEAEFANSNIELEFTASYLWKLQSESGSDAVECQSR